VTDSERRGAAAAADEVLRSRHRRLKQECRCSRRLLLVKQECRCSRRLLLVKQECRCSRPLLLVKQECCCSRRLLLVKQECRCCFSSSSGAEEATAAAVVTQQWLRRCSAAPCSAAEIMVARFPAGSRGTYCIDSDIRTDSDKNIVDSDAADSDDADSDSFASVRRQRHGGDAVMTQACIKIRVRVSVQPVLHSDADAGQLMDSASSRVAKPRPRLRDRTAP
jgi:hypothetical protein